jgi:hypothetical protein
LDNKQTQVRDADQRSKAAAAAQKRYNALQEEFQSLQRVHSQCEPLSRDLRAEHERAMLQLKV